MNLFGKKSAEPHALDDVRYPVRKSDAEWREQLHPMQYKVARQAATERPFTGQFWDHWSDGAYRCVGCGQVLFESAAKFDAGCGWPSWWQEIEPGRVERLVDDSLGMRRVEVRCSSAAPTWAMSSRTARRPPASASASTLQPLISCPKTRLDC